jgi:hypothetical protein
MFFYFVRKGEWLFAEEGIMSSTAVKGLAALACGGVCLGLGWRASSSEGSSKAESKSGSDNGQSSKTLAHPAGSDETTEQGEGGAAGGAPALVPELMAVEGMRIEKMVLARGVNRSETERVPLEPGTSFEADGRRVYVFLEVDNPDEVAGELLTGDRRGRGANGKSERSP